MTRQKDKHWSDVKASLEKAGSCLAEVALRLGISGTALSKVKRVPNAKHQSAIAKALGTTPQAIWPTRYYVASGKAIRPSIWMRNNNRVGAFAPVKNRKAA